MTGNDPHRDPDEPGFVDTWLIPVAIGLGLLLLVMLVAAGGWPE